MGSYKIPIRIVFWFGYLSCFACAYSAGFGGAFSSGPTAPGNWIRIANSTLVVPKPPMPQTGLISLWTGMGTDDGDLIQALTESYSGTINVDCGILNGTWCSWASILDNTGQKGGRQVITKPGDLVTQSYMYNDATDLYDQFVLINGVVVSSYSSSSGHAIGWGTAEECNEAYPAYPCGIVPQHDWINTVLVLDQAQPDYNGTFGNGRSTGTLQTKDGGKTWRGARLRIQAIDYTPTCPDNPTLTTQELDKFNVTCSTDYSGANLYITNAASFQACGSLCGQTSGCAGAVYLGKKCTLKSSIGKATTRAGARAVILTESQSFPPQTPTEELACPSWNNSKYSGPSNSYTIACDKDYAGGNLKFVQASSYQDCIASCDKTKSCVALTYTSKGCYLKKAVGVARSNTLAMSAVRTK
ncbi:hypothetical protein PVAG01_08033 [Phlyctema vagabunda]|uniref:Apple domain-containing protein n=1 Tax=Phlyctema vagabunda TaxID=108571 RepID=A0ABR4PE26_9HELO